MDSLTQLVIGSFIGFGFGVLSCWVFWRIQLLHRPRISICSQVARQNRCDTSASKTYRFKIRNDGKRQVIDIRLVVTVCQLRPVPGGYISSSLGTVVKESCSVLAPNTTEWSSWDIPPIYIFRGTPSMDVDSLLKMPDTRLMATLSVADAVSGVRIVKRVTYGMDDMIDGDFVKGLGMEIGQQL